MEPPPSDDKDDDDDDEDSAAPGRRYGLGTVRTLAAYEELLGVDFNRGLFRSAAALWGGKDAGFFEEHGVGGEGGGVWGAGEEEEGVADTQERQASSLGAAAAAAGVMGTRRLTELMGSFLK